MSASGEEDKNTPMRNHFVKVLLGDFQQQLMIPPKFVKERSDINFETAILQGPSGKKWQVELASNTRGTFLTTGWSKFAKDHSLSEFEFLLFRYDGNTHFTVFVFDRSACEREDLFVVNLQKRSKIFEERNNQAIPTRRSVGISSLADNKVKETDFTMAPIKSGVYRYKIVPVGSSESLLGGCMPSQNPSPKFKHKANISRKSVPVIKQRGGNIRCKSKRRPVSEEEKMKAQEAANSFTSLHPYTTFCMRAREVYKLCALRFPMKFARKHLPRTKTEMVLHGPNGKSWPVLLIPRERYSFSKGWSAFVRANNLEEGDHCVFELLDRTVFQVHIFRVVDEISPAVKNV